MVGKDDYSGYGEERHIGRGRMTLPACMVPPRRRIVSVCIITQT